MTKEKADDVAVLRNAEGWRAGKPTEDPDKMKSWGIISARPSEFLICMSGGKVAKAGQGASVFKFPWNSVAIVPTTVQRMHFVADQVTSEKVGVKVTGIAVYRIASPLVAFRMVNFSYPERAQEKLREMLEEMFVGAVRRLVANLTVEECMTRRKDALALELMREVAPVVQGRGHPGDSTEKGWGIVLDTIEIQDVRVLSQTVFVNMQAAFREELARSAALAKLAAESEVKRVRDAALERGRLEEIAAKARVEERRVDQERMLKLGEATAAQEVALAKLAAQAQVDAQTVAQSRAQKLAQIEADRAQEAARGEALLEAARVKMEVDLAEWQRTEVVVEAHTRVVAARKVLKEGQLVGERLDVARSQLRQDQELERLARQRDIENQVTPEVIQLAVAQKLPEMAQAFHQKMGQVHVTAVDGANPFGYVAAAVEGVMGLARSAGLELPKPKDKAP